MSLLTFLSVFHMLSTCVREVSCSFFLYSSLLFKMASTIAFRGLKNAGRLAKFLSLSPKVFTCSVSDCCFLCSIANFLWLFLND